MSSYPDLHSTPVVRWSGPTFGDEWTLGLPYSPEYRSISLAEAQRLYGEGASVLVADGDRDGIVTTTETPEQVEDRLAAESRPAPVVRWIGEEYGDGWTRGTDPDARGYRELTLAEAQSLYEAGATVMLAGGQYSEFTPTSESPLEVEERLR